MFDGGTLVVEALYLPPDIKTHFKVGEKVLVLFGDTPIPGILCSVYSLADNDEVMWNVKTNASGQTYPIHEGFLRHP